MPFVGERRQRGGFPSAICSERQQQSNRGKNASARSFSVRRCAIPDARNPPRFPAGSGRCPQPATCLKCCPQIPDCAHASSCRP
jgi:hypothetical protein